MTPEERDEKIVSILTKICINSGPAAFNQSGKNL